MRSGLVFTAIAMIGIGLIGCNTSSVLETRRLATTAALSNYPGNPQKSDRLVLAAIDDEGAKTVRIFNFSDDPVPASNVWVNGRFMKQIGPIGGRSFVAVRYSELLEGGAGVLDLSKVPDEQIQKVEIQTENGLFSILGPAKS